MSTPTGPGSRGSLSKALIVSRAVDLARTEGLSAVTMRRIAAELGVEAMSLYHHIPTKATLLVLMADWSLSRVPAPDPQLPWSDQLVDLLVETYRAGVENPVLFEVIASEPIGEHHVPRVDPETGVASAAFVEMVLTLLDRSELPMHQQVEAYRGLIGLLVGFIVVRADGFLTTGTAFGGRRTVRTPSAEVNDPTSRLAQLGPMLVDSDPVVALRASLGWFLRGLAQTGTSSAE
jgi:AcrR family transcriptional regulator